MDGRGSGVGSGVIFRNLPLVKVLVQGFGAHDYIPSKFG